MNKIIKRKKSKFQIELEKKGYEQILLLVFIGCLFFCVAIWGINGISYDIYQREHLKELKEAFRKTEERTLYYLTKEIKINYIPFLEGERKELRYEICKYNAETEMKIELILSDKEGEIMFTTFSRDELNLHRREFQKIISDNCLKEGNIYRAAYSFTEDYPDYVITIPIEKEREIIGSVSAYLKGNGWPKTISNDPYDTIIVNRKNDVIYCSNVDFLKKKNSTKYEYEGDDKYIFVEGKKFLVTREKLWEEEITIYSFMYKPQNKSYFFVGVLIIVTLGVLWTIIFYKVLEKMAEKTASSVSLLTKEIRVIRDQDPHHEIQMSTGDEIDEIAYQINKMIKRIHKLNDKNIELLQINNRMEMENLQERINPHFIYNTLDTIRFLIIEDPVKAEKLIAEFTGILRYSINTSLRKIKLREDLKYMKDYLNIQKTRFGSKFTYEIQIEPECLNYSIPKLLLQPLIENSIKYGFKKKAYITIKIYGKVENDYLILEVHDDGMGQPKSTMDTLRSIIELEELTSAHYGLRDINKRICMEYGKESGMLLDSLEGEYFKVVLKLYMGEKNVSDLVSRR